MLRLKIELETCYAEDRADTLKKAHEEHMDEVKQLKEQMAFKEQVLLDEISSIKSKLADRNRRLDDANEKADKQILQIRMILDKSERTHQREMLAEISDREDQLSECLVSFRSSQATIHSIHISEHLQDEFNEREASIKQEFEKRLQDIKQKYSDELSVSRNDLVLKYKKENGLSHSFKSVHQTTNISISPHRIAIRKNEAG